MIAELGFVALLLAMALSVLQSFFPMIGVVNKNLWLMQTGRPLTLGVFVMLTIGFLCLGYSHAVDDFTVAYVANHSNSELPMQYKISSIWGGHEGSMYLWIYILSGWALAVSIFSKSLPRENLATILAVMGMVTLGFLLFLILTSNPFERILPIPPEDGRDLNPLLQDIGLILHPPMLYMGYVGFSVAFVFAISALISGNLDSAWARWSRPWTNIAWVFMTLGIALGSWWAYYELGWGGWWFWDPVENASFMPWLMGTALIHSLAVTEKRGMFKSWTVLLAIFTFSFSLLGTFLVRSGVLTSVHAFAADPERGYFILALLALTIGGSLTLFAIKAPGLRSRASFTLFSRESFLLINNVLLSVSCFMVLLGTLYPLIFDALGLRKISVGPPFFDFFFTKLMAVLILALAIGPLLKWKKNEYKTLKKFAAIGAVASIALGFIAMYWYGNGEINFAVWLGLSLCFWLGFGILKAFKDNTRNAKSFMGGLKKLAPSFYGMQFAHFGMIITTVGVVMVSNYETEEDIRMAVGEAVQYDEYEFRFEGAYPVIGPNYSAMRGEMLVFRDDEKVVRLSPEKRNYNASGQIMTEADIDAGLMKDLYVSMGEELNSNGDWSVRIHIKPFVRWIWLGTIFMSIGAVLAILDRRYRKTIKVKN